MRSLIDRIPFAKIMTVLAISMLLSLGMCGVSIAAPNAGSRSGFWGTIQDWVLYAGIIGFWLSVLGLVLTLAAFILLQMSKG